MTGQINWIACDRSCQCAGHMCDNNSITCGLLPVTCLIRKRIHKTLLNSVEAVLSFFDFVAAFIQGYRQQKNVTNDVRMFVRSTENTLSERYIISQLSSWRSYY
jgi:hypothetical protein